MSCSPIVTPHPFLVEVLQNVNGSYSIVQVYCERGILKSPACPNVTLKLGEIFDQLPPQPPIDEVRESPPPYSSPLEGPQHEGADVEVSTRRSETG